MGCVETIAYDKFPKQRDKNYKYPEMRGETIVMERIRIPGRIPVRDRKKRREKERCRAA